MSLVNPGIFGRAARIARTEGLRPLAQRAVRRAHQSLEVDSLDLPILPPDIVDPASVPPVRAALVSGTRPVVGWLTAPPSLGSGGHTTMFRMVSALEASGVRCVLYLYDRYGGDVARHERVVREGWPGIQAEVRSADGLISGVDACFATSWETAHVLVTRSTPAVRRLYFIQDYEPYFYPRGSLYSLAEDSYRLGFRHVALGAMVADTIQREVGVGSDIVPFGCDSETYHLIPGTPRSGIVFYSRPTVARRGYLHISMALTEFHRRHPEQEIHAYGQKVTDAPVPVTWHGRLWPEELNELYNRTLGGIAMSFTNITLVAGEMLAAGNIPVVNDSPFARAVLDNPHIAWAPATARALADALCRVVEAEDPETRAKAASASVQTGWAPTEAALIALVQEELAHVSAGP